MTDRSWNRLAAAAGATVFGVCVLLVLAGSAFATHPRPGGGSPVRVPLVQAFKPCTAPNSTHVEPLAEPSCSPPDTESHVARLGTTGAGGGFVQLQVQCRPPSTDTPPCTPNDGNEIEDVRITVSVRDVLCVPGGPCGGFPPDYTSGLALKLPLRITDHANDPAGVCTNGSGSGCVTATAQDFVFAVTFGCGASSEPEVGGLCDLGVGMNTLVPNAVREFQRGSWSINGPIQILDPGPDLNFGQGQCRPPVNSCFEGDENVFLTQGIFAP